ncbi:MAG: hypothetical protein AAF497_03145 [Planctomycetota bacterium]
MTNNKADILNLCGKVRDGSITAAELAELEKLLIEHNAAADYYVQFMSVCSGIEQLVSTDIRDLDDLDYQQVVDLPPCVRIGHRAPKRIPWRRSLVRPMLGVCAALLLGVVAWFGYQLTNSEPSAIATLIDVQAPFWSDESQPEVGSSLNGTYSLVAGAARVRFESGAELLVQAPSTFAIESSDSAALESGSLMLLAPETAKGFKVTTPWGTVVDHGTRIGIRSNSMSGLEAHVFEGRGEVTREDSPSSGILEAGQAVTVNATDQTFALMDAVESYFLSSLDEASRLPRVTGDVELLLSAPKSVRRVYRELANLRHPIVFAEQQSVPTDHMRRVTHTGTGQPRSLQAATEKLARGQLVDSYFVHFTMPLRERESGNPLHAQGTLTFDRPIVGVVTHEPVRFRKFVGHAATDYQLDMETGLEDATDDNPLPPDRIMISQDRRTLTFELNIAGLNRSRTPDDIDQFRVLVEAATN